MTFRKNIENTEFGAFYANYLGLVSPETELISGFLQGKKEVINFFQAIATEKWDYKYAPKKWNIKEVLQHIIDVERIFMYRCFRLSRQDATELSGFDENAYIAPSLASQKSTANLLEEYETLRDCSIVMLKSFSDENLQFLGLANGLPISARAAAFIVLGHEKWHQKIVVERYL